MIWADKSQKKKYKLPINMRKESSVLLLIRKMQIKMIPETILKGSVIK